VVFRPTLVGLTRVRMIRVRRCSDQRVAAEIRIEYAAAAR
jgi:hypothetical protein